jgi:hypothetical protein
MTTVAVTKVTGMDLARKACEATMHGQTSSVSLGLLAKCEHSPLRTQLYWVEFKNIPTFVSVHFVRHKIGVEHFVKSMRDDLYIDSSVPVDRNTPVNHCMLINAQALIQMCRKRLCYKSHVSTVAVFRRLVRRLVEAEPELKPYLVPECVYRNTYCPEPRECRPGLIKVCNAYAE